MTNAWAGKDYLTFEKAEGLARRDAFPCAAGVAMNVSNCVQVTAYSVIKSNGQTGILPTGVNFQIGPGSNQSGSSSASSSSAVSASNVQYGYSCCILWHHLLGACDTAQEAPQKAVSLHLCHAHEVQAVNAAQC